jgi:hypothetical protein
MIGQEVVRCLCAGHRYEPGACIPPFMAEEV